MKATKSDIVHSAINYIKKKHPSLQECDIEDLTQDAWLWVSSHQSKNWHSAVRMYLQKRVEFYLDLPQSLEASGLTPTVECVDPLLILEWYEAAHALNDSLSELSPRYRDAILLKYGLALDVEGSLSLDQIGEIFYLTTARIQQIISKAIRQLKSKYAYTLKKSCRVMLEGYDFYYRSTEIKYRETDVLVKEFAAKEHERREKERAEELRMQKEWERQEEAWKEEIRQLQEEREKKEAKLMAEREALEKTLKNPFSLNAFNTLEEIGSTTKVLIDHYDCPVEIIEFFMQDHSRLLDKKKEGFYLVVASPSNKKYIIANYGYQNRTDLGFPGIAIKAWGISSAPPHLQSLVSRPQFPRKLYYQASA
jgi:hypothetical protein